MTYYYKRTNKITFVLIIEASNIYFTVSMNALIAISIYQVQTLFDIFLFYILHTILNRDCTKFQYIFVNVFAYSVRCCEYGPL